MHKEELKYCIALTLIPNIGDFSCRQLCQYFGNAEEVFKARKSKLIKVNGIGELNAANLLGSKTEAIARAEEELEFIQKYAIQPINYFDKTYPERLRYCYDSPFMLYYKGNVDLNQEKIVAVVGTRMPDEYGVEVVNKFIDELSGSGILVVSGLAYGIDILAHKRSLDVGLNTIGVLAHGLDRIYPSTHKGIAKKMINAGGLLTDFISGTNPDAVNFPKRNRIVAGMCDALVVIQSKREGGSLITATIANSYNKDVFAFPGRAGDVISEGCNGLIKKQRAVLIENAADMMDAMNWTTTNKVKPKAQMAINIQLSEAEQKVADLFKDKKQLHIDEICYSSEMTIGNVSTILLQLELNNLIRSNPGKIYEYLA